MDTSFNRGSVSIEDSDVADLLNYNNNNSITKEGSIEETVEIRSGKNKGLIGVTLNHITDSSVYIENDENSLSAMSSFGGTSGNPVVDFVDLTDNQDANSGIPNRLNENFKCKLIENGMDTLKEKPSTKDKKSKEKNIIRLVLPPISPDCYEKNLENGMLYLKPSKVGLVNVKVDTKDGRTLACARLVEDSSVKTLNNKPKLKSKSLPTVNSEQTPLRKETSISPCDTVDTCPTITSPVKTISNKPNLNISSSSNEEDILFGSPVTNTLVSDRISSCLFESTSVPLIENSFEFDSDGVNHCDLNDDSLVSHEVEIVEERDIDVHFSSIPVESSTNFVNTDNVSSLSCATPLTFPPEPLHPLNAEFIAEDNEEKLCAARKSPKRTTLKSFIERDVLDLIKDDHEEVLPYQIETHSNDPVSSVSNCHNQITSNDKNNVSLHKLDDIVVNNVSVSNIECVQTNVSSNYESTFSIHHNSDVNYQVHVVSEDSKCSNAYSPLVTNEIKNEESIPVRKPTGLSMPIIDLDEYPTINYPKPVITKHTRNKKLSKVKDSEAKKVEHKILPQITVDNVNKNEPQFVVNSSECVSDIVTLESSQNNTIIDSKPTINSFETSENGNDSNQISELKSEDFTKSITLNMHNSSESTTTGNNSVDTITDEQQKVVLGSSESVLHVDHNLKTQQDLCISTNDNNKSDFNFETSTITAEINDFSESVNDNQYTVLDSSKKDDNSVEDRTKDYQKIIIENSVVTNDDNLTAVHNSECLNKNHIRNKEENLHLSDLIKECSLAAEVNSLSTNDNKVLSLEDFTPPVVNDNMPDTVASVTEKQLDLKTEYFTSNTSETDVKSIENQQESLILDRTPSESSSVFIPPKNLTGSVQHFPSQISPQKATRDCNRRHSDSYLIKDRKTNIHFNKKSNSNHIPNNITLNEISNFEEPGIHYMLPQSQRLEILHRFPDWSSVNSNSIPSNYKKKPKNILQDVQNGNNCYGSIFQQKSIKLRRHSMHPSFEYNTQNKLKINNFPKDSNVSGYSSNDESPSSKEFVQLVINKPVQIYNVAKSGKSIEEIAKRLANQPKNEIFKQSEHLKTSTNYVKERSHNIDDICEKLSNSLPKSELENIQNKFIEKPDINVLSSSSQNITEATISTEKCITTNISSHKMSEKDCTSKQCKNDLLPDLHLPKCIEVTVVKTPKESVVNCKKPDETSDNINWNVSVTKLPKENEETKEKSDLDNIQSKVEMSQLSNSKDSVEDLTLNTYNTATITSSCVEDSSLPNNSNSVNTVENNIESCTECVVNTVTDNTAKKLTNDSQIPYFNSLVDNSKPINLVKKIEKSTAVDFSTDLNSNLNSSNGDFHFKCSISCDRIAEDLLKTLWKIKADSVKKTLKEGKKKHSSNNKEGHLNLIVNEDEGKNSSITPHESESNSGNVEILDDSIPLNVGLEVECCNSSSSSCLASPNGKHDMSETKGGRRKKSVPKKCVEQLAPLFSKVDKDHKEGVGIKNISDVEYDPNGSFKENIVHTDTSSAVNISNNKSLSKKNKPLRKSRRKKRRGKIKKIIHQKNIKSRINENPNTAIDHKGEMLKEINSGNHSEITITKETNIYNESIIENNITVVQEICVETSELSDMPVLQAESYVALDQSINSEPAEKLDECLVKREMSKSPPILIKEASLSPKHDVEFSHKNYDFPVNTSPLPELEKSNISNFKNEPKEMHTLNENSHIPVITPLDEAVENTVTGQIEVVKSKPIGTLSLKTKTHIRGKVLAKSTNFTKTKGVLHGKCFNPDLKKPVREQKVKQDPDKILLERCNSLRKNGINLHLLPEVVQNCEKLGNSCSPVNVKFSEQFADKIHLQHDNENIASHQKKPNGIIPQENILFLANDKNNKIIKGIISSPDELQKKIDFPDLDSIDTSAEKSAELNGIICELEETLSRLSSDQNSIDNSIPENSESNKIEASNEVRHFIEVNNIKQDKSPALDANNLFDSTKNTETSTKFDNTLKKNEDSLQEVPEVVNSLLNIEKLCDTLTEENYDNKNGDIEKITENESIIDLTVSDEVSDQDENKLNKISEIKICEVPSPCNNIDVQVKSINEEVKNLKTSKSSERNSNNFSSSKGVQEILEKREHILCEGDMSNNIISNKLTDSDKKIEEIPNVFVENVASSCPVKFVFDNSASTSISEKNIKPVKKEIGMSMNLAEKLHNVQSSDTLTKSNLHEKADDHPDILIPLGKDVKNYNSIYPENFSHHVKNLSKKIIVKRKYVKINGAFTGPKGKCSKNKINENRIQSLNESQEKFDHDLCHKPKIFTRNSKKQIDSKSIKFLERTENRSHASLLNNIAQLELENVEEIVKQSGSKNGRRGIKSQKKIEKYSKQLLGEKFLLKDQKKTSSLRVTESLLNNISPEENKHYLRPINSDNNTIKSNTDSSLIKSNLNVKKGNDKLINGTLDKFRFSSQIKANAKKLGNKVSKKKQKSINSKAAVSTKNICQEPIKKIEPISSSNKSPVKKRNSSPKSPKKGLRSSIRLSEKSILEDLDHRKLKELICGAQKILNSRRMKSNIRSSGDNFLINDNRSNEELFLGMFHSEMKENSEFTERITADERITAEALLNLSKIVENHDQMNNDNSTEGSIYSNLDISDELRTFMGSTLAESDGELKHIVDESKQLAKPLSFAENLCDKRLLLYRNILNRPTLLNLMLFKKNKIEVSENNIDSFASEALNCSKNSSLSCLSIPSTSEKSAISKWNSHTVNSGRNVSNPLYFLNNHKNINFVHLYQLFNQLIPADMKNFIDFRNFTDEHFLFLLELLHMMFIERSTSSRTTPTHYELLRINGVPNTTTSVVDVIEKTTFSYRSMINKLLSNVRSHLQHDPFLLRNIVRTFPSDFLLKLYRMNANKLQSRALTKVSCFSTIKEAEFSTERKENAADIIFENEGETSNIIQTQTVSTEHTSNYYNSSVISSNKNLKQKIARTSNKADNYYIKPMSKNLSLRHISSKHRYLKDKVKSRRRNKKIQKPKYKQLNGIVNDFDMKNLQPHIKKMSLFLSKGRKLLISNEDKQALPSNKTFSIDSKPNFDCDTTSARPILPSKSAPNNEISLINGKNRNKCKIYDKIENIAKLMQVILMNPIVPRFIHSTSNGLLKDNLSVWFNKNGVSRASCSHHANVLYPSALHFNNDVLYDVCQYFSEKRAALFDFNLNSQIYTTSFNNYNTVILTGAEMKFLFSRLKTVSNVDTISNLDVYNFYKLLISNFKEGNSTVFTVHIKPILNGEIPGLKHKTIVSKKKSLVYKLTSNSILLSFTLHNHDLINMQTYSVGHNKTFKQLDKSVNFSCTNYFPERTNNFEKLLVKKTPIYSLHNEQSSSSSSTNEITESTNKIPANSNKNLNLFTQIVEETVNRPVQNKNKKFKKNGIYNKKEGPNLLEHIKQKEHNKLLLKKDHTMNASTLLTKKSTSKKNIYNIRHKRCVTTNSGVNKTHSDNLDVVVKKELSVNSVRVVDQSLVNSKLIIGKFSQMPISNHISLYQKSKLSSTFSERFSLKQFYLKYVPNFCKLFMLNCNRNLFLNNIFSVNDQLKHAQMLEYQRKNNAELVSENKKDLLELRRFRKRKVESLKEVSPIKLSCYREITTDSVKIKVTDDAPNAIEENRVRIPIPLACHLYLEVKKLSNSVHLRRKISEIPHPTHFGYSGNSSQILNISSSLKSDIDVMPEESIYLSDVSTSTVSTKNEFAVKHPLSLEKYVKKYKVTINKNEIFGKVNGSHNRIKEVFHNSSPFEKSLSSSCIKSFDVPTIIETQDEPGPSMLQVQTTSNIFSPKQILNNLPNYCQTVESSSETILVPCINADRKMFAIKAPRNDSYLNELPMNSNSVTMKEIYDIYSKVSSDFLSILTNQFHSNVILPNTLNYLPIHSQVLHQENENFEDLYEHQNYSYSKKNPFPSKSVENNLSVKTEQKPVNTLKMDSNFHTDLPSELNVSPNMSESSILSSITEPIEDNKVNEVIDVMMQNCAKDTPHLNTKESLPSSQNGSTEESHSNSSTYKDPVETSSSEIIGSPYFSAKSPDTTNPGYHNPGELYFDSGNVEVERSGTIKKSRKEEEETPGSDISPVDSTVEDEDESPSTNGRKITVISETTPSENNKSSKNDTKLSSSSVNANSSLEGSNTYENISPSVSSLSSSTLNTQVNKIDFTNKINKRTRNLRRKNEIIKSSTKLNPFVKLKYFQIDRIDEVLREFCLKKVTFPLNVSRRLHIDERKYTHTVIKRKWISFYADSQTSELKEKESIRGENQERGVNPFISTSVFKTNSAQEFSHNLAASSVRNVVNPNLPLKSNEPLPGTTVKRKRGRPRKVLPAEIQNKEAVNICNQSNIESTRPQYTKVTTSSSVTSRNHKQDEEEVSSSGLDTDCFEDSNLGCFSANKFEHNYISSSDVSNLDSVTDQISSTVQTPTKTTFYKDKLYKKTFEEPVSSSGIRAECSEEENYSDKISKKNKRRLDFKGILSNVESDENSLSSPYEGGSSSSSSQLDNSATEDDNTEFNYLDFFSEKNKSKHHGIREDHVKRSSNKDFIDDSHLDADDEFSCDPDFMSPLFDYSKINLQTLSEMFEKEAEGNDEEISNKEKPLDISNVQSCSFFNFNLNDNTTQEDVEEDVERRKQSSAIKGKVGKRRKSGFYPENTRRKRNTRFSVKRQMNFDQIETTQEQELDEMNDESCAEDLAEAQFKGFREETEVCTCTRDDNSSWSCGCCRNNLRRRGLIIKFIKQLLTPDTWSGTEKDKSSRKTFSNVSNSTTATYLSVHSSPCANSVVQFPSSDCHEKDFDEESIIHKNISTTTVSDVLLSSSPCEIMLGISKAKSLHTTVKDSYDKSLRPRKRHRNRVINSINETLVCDTNKKDSFVHTIADTTRLGSSNDNATAVHGSTREQNRESFSINEGTAFAQTAECSIPDPSNTYFIYHGAQTNYSEVKNRQNIDKNNDNVPQNKRNVDNCWKLLLESSSSTSSVSSDDDDDDSDYEDYRKKRKRKRRRLNS